MPSSFPDRELARPRRETTLLVWLLEVLQPMNRTRVKQLLKSGRVAVNSVPTTRHDHPLRPTDRLSILQQSQRTRREHQGKSVGLPVIYQDDAVIAIDKPSSLLTVATENQKVETAFAYLLAQLEEQHEGRPFVVHRLDRDTSGLLLFARSPEVRDQLQSNWEAVAKTYLAVVEGKPREPEGTVENYLLEERSLRVRAVPHPRESAKRAVTHYKLLTSCERYSLLEVRLETGRKHQIRIHLAGLGCPVIGDDVYNAKTNPAGRLGLHAWKLAFAHPITGKRLELESPFPSKLRKIVGEY